MSLRATVALIAASAATVVHGDPVERDAFAALERPKPAAVFQYGPASSQALDVFLPRGEGPHPIAILTQSGHQSLTSRVSRQHMSFATSL